MSRLPLFPRPLRFAGHRLVAASVDLLPSSIRSNLGLAGRAGVSRGTAGMLRLTGRFLERLQLESMPATQACLRLGLPPDYLRSGGR